MTTNGPTPQLRVPPRVHTVPKPLPSDESPPPHPHIRIQRPHSHFDLRGQYDSDGRDLGFDALGFADIYTSDVPALPCPPSLSTSWSGSSISIADDSTSTSTVTRAHSVSTSSSPSQPGTSADWSRSSSRTRDAENNTPTPNQAQTTADTTTTTTATTTAAQTATNTTTTAAATSAAAATADANADTYDIAATDSDLNSATTIPLSKQPSPTPSSTPSVRKPAPGLAARLKALGFGSSSKRSANPTPPSELVGRLDEQQLRQLDEKHLAGSISSVISRRGRPWRGAGASAPLKSSVSQPNLRAASAIPDQSPRLPEIKAPDPLVMDTQKYRLPDHTNGNGTKVTLETRREHLGRQPPAPSPVRSAMPPPPPPPPKDTPPPPATPPAAVSQPQQSDYVPGLSSYFTPGRNRPGSIYTLSRASFANQLAQLTSLQLPDADSLSSKVSAIPTATAATKALINAADQIRSWISKAQEVIGGLDSEDDVEWAAAGGREGLGDVENAIIRFEELINAYVSAIEELQCRDDSAEVLKDDTHRAVSQMEIILDEWSKIKATLHNVRGQVEIAMEWEELWNNVLGDIQTEMDDLSRLVFEMEERRHKSIVAGAGGADNVDIGDLETIVEDGPVTISHVSKSPGRMAIPAPMSPNTATANASLSQDDSSLLALFARMQPLRASLDFLPMRLSVFEARAEKNFPTACEELDMRRSGLDNSYRKLEKDAESLRKELGEDRWVIVFRGAGRQAQKMHESVERSLLKLRESVEAGLHLNNPAAMSKKIEGYEAKKMHYGPAIERVLSIIDRGVKDRLTVNGEILRLHNDLQTRWAKLKQNMQEMDGVVEEILADNRSKQLRDSVSSLLSNDRSTVGGSGHDTPGSSPPSSVIMTSLGFDPHTPVTGKPMLRSPNSLASSNRRYSSLPEPASAFSKRQAARLSTIPSSSAGTPVHGSALPRPASTLDHRPRWNTSTNTSNLEGGQGSYKAPHSHTAQHSPNTLTTPKGRAVSAASPSSTGSRLPTMRNIFHRATSESPQVERSPSRTSHSRLGLRERLTSPGPYSQQTLSKKTPNTTMNNRRTSLQPPRAGHGADEGYSRPASSLASHSSSHRDSSFPRMPGRASPMLQRRKEQEAKENKPRWRF